MHDLNLAALYCRRLIFLKDGGILEDGPTEKVFTPEVLARVYDTPMEVGRHPVHGRPYALTLPLTSGVQDAEEAEEVLGGGPEMKEGGPGVRGQGSGPQAKRQVGCRGGSRTAQRSALFGCC